MSRESVLVDELVCTDATGTREEALACLRRFREAKVGMVSLTVGSIATTEAVFRTIAQHEGIVSSFPDEFARVRAAGDIGRCRTEGRLGISYNLQCTTALAGDLSLIGVFYDLGVRQMLMAFNRRNLVADGCHERADGGLSLFGVSVIEEMNRVGMIVDLTHTSYKATMEAMEVSTAPVIFSHSNPRKLKDHRRNITDDQIVGCARTGGLIGVTGFGLILGDNEATPALIARHMDYVAQLVGPQHVGFGSDHVHHEAKLIAAVRRTPEIWPAEGGYRDVDRFAFLQPEQFAAIPEELSRLGYGDADIRAMLGGNYVRVANAVWKN